MKLENDYNIQGSPERAEYKRNENGLYTVDIKDFLAVDSDGNKYHAYIRIPNAKIPVNDEEGIIDLNLDEIKCFSPTNELEEKDDTIWEIIIPDEPII